jgi:hypothetical protein
MITKNNTLALIICYVDLSRNNININNAIAEQLYDETIFQSVCGVQTIHIRDTFWHIG